jgi:hypothetical protein
MAFIRKRYKAFSLAKYILVIGITTNILCIYYYYLKLFYIIFINFSYCGNYIKAKKLYNRILIVSFYKFFIFFYFIK